MADSAAAPSALSFSRETFAKLSPGPFLLAHLKPASSRSSPTRPSGRSPLEFRQPVVNTGSLSHSNGSAVIRVGDTAVVCGVRAEILRAQDIPQPYRIPISTSSDPTQDTKSSYSASAEVEELGLLVPNLELSTGCSPAHLPGNPPSTLAQSLSQRILSLLHISRLISADDLRITYTEPKTDDDEPDAPPQVVTKAYWTLYIDILVMSLDGNPFDAAWGAVMAALANTTLPRAQWNPDIENVLCPPDVAEGRELKLNGLPVASTFAVFSTASPMKRREEAEAWVLADPDGAEEEVCREGVTITVTPKKEDGSGGILRIEKSGGGVVDVKRMKELIGLATDRWSDWDSVLRDIGR